MRLSIRENDPGYDFDKAIRCNVYLDGKKLEACHTADEEQGIAICYVGNNKDEKTFYGEVEIKLND